MSGKLIKELPTHQLWRYGVNNHLLVYQHSDDDVTYKLTIGDLFKELLWYHIEWGSGLTRTMQGTRLMVNADFTKIFVTDTTPSNAKEGDYWLHTDSEHLGNLDQYQNVSDVMSWVFIVNMKGHDGIDGTNGADGITPHIDGTTKHWMIGETDTNIVAEGQNGINGTSGSDGYSISATTEAITGGTRVTIHSTNPSVNDQIFDVMNGNAGGYTQGDGINISGSTISVKLGNGLAIDSQTGNINVTSNTGVSVSQTLTLLASGWNSKSQTVSFSHDTAKRNVIDITPSEIPKWATYGVYAISETSSEIVFNCKDTPSEDLTFKVTSMEVIS